MPDALTRAVQRALRDAPCSVAALAEAARVPQSTLSRILAGERAATPTVAQAVARALDQWSAGCARLAAAVRQADTQRRKIDDD